MDVTLLVLNHAADECAQSSTPHLLIDSALLDQLAIGGRLVAPVARSEKEQQLVMVEQMSSQRYQRTVLDEIFFVPLQSG